MYIYAYTVIINTQHTKINYIIAENIRHQWVCNEMYIQGFDKRASMLASYLISIAHQLKSFMENVHLLFCRLSIHQHAVLNHFMLIVLIIICSCWIESEFWIFLCRAGLLDDAAIVAKMALEAAPKFVVTHFTLANILASKVRLAEN